MGSIDDIVAYCDRLEKATEAATKIIAKKANEELEKTNKESLKEVSPIYQEYIRKYFKESVDDFYNDYKPKRYNRRNSLYNILKIKTSGEYNWPTYNDTEDLYDKSATVDRSGNGLFDKVFMQGWHGGAESGPGHPEPGTPYYKPSKSFWSRAAERSDKSPGKAFDERLSEGEVAEILPEMKRIIQKNRVKLAQKLQVILDNTIAELLRGR